METTRSVGVVILLVLVSLVQSQPTTDHDCNGRSELCMGPFKYMECRQDGTGRMVTDGGVLYCPPNTRCQNEGEISCIPLKAEPITEGEDTIAELLVSESIPVVNQLGEVLPTTSTETIERATNVTPPSEENSVNEQQVENHIVEETASSKVTREQPESGKEEAVIIDAVNVQNEPTTTPTKLPSNEINITSATAATTEVISETTSTTISEETTNITEADNEINITSATAATTEVISETTSTTISEETTNITEADNENSSASFNETTALFMSTESSSLVSIQKTKVVQEDGSNIDFTISTSQPQETSTNEQTSSRESALTKPFANSTQTEKIDQVTNNADLGTTMVSTKTMESSLSTTIKEIDGSNVTAPNDAQSNDSSTIAPVEAPTLVLQAGQTEKKIAQAISVPIVDNSSLSRETEISENPQMAPVEKAVQSENALEITASNNASSSKTHATSESRRPADTTIWSFEGEEESSPNLIPSVGASEVQEKEIPRVPSSSQGAKNSANEEPTGFSESNGVPKGAVKPVGNIERVETEDGILNNTGSDYINDLTEQMVQSKTVADEPISTGNIIETSELSHNFKITDTQNTTKDVTASEVKTTSVVGGTGSSAAEGSNNTEPQDSGVLPIPEIIKSGATGVQERNKAEAVGTSEVKQSENAVGVVEKSGNVSPGHDISETADSIYQGNLAFSGSSGSIVESELTGPVHPRPTVGISEDAGTPTVEGTNGTLNAGTVGSPEVNEDIGNYAQNIDASRPSVIDDLNGSENNQTAENSEIIRTEEIVAPPDGYEDQGKQSYAETVGAVTTSTSEVDKSGTQGPIETSGANVTSHIPKIQAPSHISGSEENGSIAGAAQGEFPVLSGFDAQIVGKSTSIGENANVTGLSVNPGSASNLVPAGTPHDSSGISQFSAWQNAQSATDVTVKYPEQEQSEFGQPKSQHSESTSAGISQPGAAGNVENQPNVAFGVTKTGKKQSGGGYAILTDKKHQLAVSQKNPQNVLDAGSQRVGAGLGSQAANITAAGLKSGQGFDNSVAHDFGSAQQPTRQVHASENEGSSGSAIKPELNSEGQVLPVGGQGWSGSFAAPELSSEAQSSGQVGKTEGQSWSGSVISPEGQAPGQVPVGSSQGLDGNIINPTLGSNEQVAVQIPAAGGQRWDGNVINSTLGSKGQVPVGSTQGLGGNAINLGPGSQGQATGQIPAAEEAPLPGKISVVGGQVSGGSFINPGLVSGGQTPPSGGQGWSVAEGQAPGQIPAGGQGWVINLELGSEGQGTGHPTAFGEDSWRGSVAKPGVGSKGHTPGQIPAAKGQGWGESVINPELGSEGQSEGNVPAPSLVPGSGSISAPGSIISRETNEESVESLESMQYKNNKNSIPGSSNKQSNAQASTAESASTTTSSESDESPEFLESSYGSAKPGQSLENLQSPESLESDSIDGDASKKSTQSVESAESNESIEADESKSNDSAEVYSKEKKDSEETNKSDESNETDNHSKSDSSESKKSEKSKNQNKSYSSESVENHKAKNMKLKRKFECQNEGRFEDPNNCRKYYICSLKDSGKLKKYHLKCHDHQVYNMETKECIHKCE